MKLKAVLAENQPSIEAETLRKLQALAQQRNISLETPDGGLLLALKLAEEYLPGFGHPEPCRSLGARRRRRSVSEQITLVLRVKDYCSLHGAGASRACDELAKAGGPYEGASSVRLFRAYVAARKSTRKLLRELERMRGRLSSM